MKEREARKIIELLEYVAKGVKETMSHTHSTKASDWYDKFVEQVPDPDWFE